MNENKIKGAHVFVRLLVLTLFFVVQSCPSSKSESLKIDISKKQSGNLIAMTSPENGLRFGFLQNYYSNGRVEPNDCSTVANETVSLVQVDSTRNDDCVIWEFVAIDSGYFRIINKETGQFFRPLRCGNLDSLQLEVKQVGTSNTGTCTQWKFTDIGDGRYRIANRATGNFIRAKGCSVIKDGRIPIVQVGEQFTGPCTLWKLIPEEGAPTYKYTPGLTDASKLQPSDPITVTEDNTVIENLHFTASASLSHIEIAENVKGTVIRNCKFENASVGDRNYNDGGAIRLNPGSTAIVINSEFENNFRAVRAFQSSGMQLMLSKISGIMRNAVELNASNNDSFQNVVAYNVVEWKQGYFQAKDRNGERSWIDRGDDIGFTDWFPEDGISVFSTNGTPEKPTLILGNFFRTTNLRWDFTGTFGAIATAGDGPTGSPGNYTEVRSNFGWNFTMNGFSINGGMGHAFFDNVVYADGRQKLLWEDPNNSLTATIRNAAYLYDDFNQNTPSLAKSSNNLSFYHNPWGGTHGFHNDAGSADHPEGNDPWNHDIDKTTNNWDGLTGGIHIDRWQKRFETIESLVEQYGTFNAPIDGIVNFTAD